MDVIRPGISHVPLKVCLDHGMLHFGEYRRQNGTFIFVNLDNHFLIHLLAPEHLVATTGSFPWRVSECGRSLVKSLQVGCNILVLLCQYFNEFYHARISHQDFKGRIERIDKGGGDGIPIRLIQERA